MLAAPILALVIVTGASLAVQAQERSGRQVAIAARALADTSQVVLDDAANAETSMRGYAASRDPQFLAPFTAASRQVSADVRSLIAAASTDLERSAVAEIAVAVQGEFTNLERIHSSVLAEAGAAELDALETGKVTMDQLRAQISSLQMAPSRMVLEKRAEITRLENAAQAIEIIGVTLGAMAGLAGVALFAGGVSRRVRLAADNAERLGQGEPLLPTPSSKDEFGNLSHSLIVARRLLATRLAELSAARDQAVVATQAKNNFLSRTSHELRTPLNAILGFAQLLEMAELADDDRDSAARILDAGRHLLNLINQLIDTAQIETGQLRLSVDRVEIQTLVTDVVTLMSPLAAASGIHLEHSANTRTLAALADPQRLRQILINLLSNAVKYNRHGGTVRLSYRACGPDDIEISVADTGLGLSAAEIERVFVPFDRLDADQGSIEGTGIGLPLALSLSEAMHGRIKVTSTPGSGSTFTVILPAAGRVDPDARPSLTIERLLGRQSPGSVANTDPFVVLYIEDNAANTRVLELFFSGWPGITLYTAATGRAGIDLFSGCRPDLVLLDLHLPDLPGDEVYMRLRAESESLTMQTPIIVVSADATPAAIGRMLTRGVNDYLTKPIDLRHLQNIVEALRRKKERTDSAAALHDPPRAPAKAVL